MPTELNSDLKLTFYCGIVSRVRLVQFGNATHNSHLYPAVAHPHTKLTILALDKVSTNPILFTQVPALDTVSAKLGGFLDSASSIIPRTAVVKQTLTNDLIAFLKGRFSSDSKAKQASVSAQDLSKWTEATKAVLNALPPAQLFPLTDMWRLALLDETVSNWCVTVSGTADPLQAILLKAVATLSNAEAQAASRPYVLTTLRLFSNAFSNDALSRSVLVSKRTAVTSLLVSSLLHTDGSVRTAAASLAFNIAAFLQKSRLESVRARYGPFAGSDEEGEWEIELVSAVLEAIANEVHSEDIGALLGFRCLIRVALTSNSPLNYSPSVNRVIGVSPQVLSRVRSATWSIIRGASGKGNTTCQVGEGRLW